MAYGEKYRFTWESSGGDTCCIKVLQNGFTGSVAHRAMGQAPILRREKNGPVLGTSLEFYPECAVDQEFAEFYTSDPDEYRVELYRGAALLWSGYITPELYSEPDVAPPYDVQVMATDGVGELKLEDFAKAGRVSLLSHFATLLAATGATHMYGALTLRNPQVYPQDLLTAAYINLDYMEGQTKYDVLTYLLDTLHCVITRHVDGVEDGWMLIREPDLDGVIDPTDGFSYMDLSEGTLSSSRDALMEYGSMNGHDVWPVGRMTTTVVPAKRSVILKAPWHEHNALVNPDMLTDSGWTKSTSPAPVYDAVRHGYFLGNASGGTAAYIYQNVDLTSVGLDKPLELSLEVSRGGSGRYGRTTFCTLHVRFDMSDGTAYLRKSDTGEYYWDTASGDTESIQVDTASPDDSNTQTVKLTIPACFVSEVAQSGTLVVTVKSATGLNVFHASLTCVMGEGWEDTVNISNRAREKGGAMEIALGKVDQDIVGSVMSRFLEGVASRASGALVEGSWADAHFGPLDFLAIASRGRALVSALPRIRTDGVLSVMGAGFTLGRYFLRQTYTGPDFGDDFNRDFFTARRGESFVSFVEQFSWNLVEDEVEVSAISAPGASLSIDSERVQAIRTR